MSLLDGGRDLDDIRPQRTLRKNLLLGLLLPALLCTVVYGLLIRRLRRRLWFDMDFEQRLRVGMVSIRNDQSW